MSLKQKSNLWMLISLVAGTMIGSGIFTLPATLASYGSISIIAGVITTISAVLIAFIFAKLSALIPKTGGPYAYCRAAWGNFIGFEVAYNYWIATCIGNAAVVVTCVGYLADFFPIIKDHVWLSFFLKTGMIWLFTGINILGVKNVSFLNMLTFGWSYSERLSFTSTGNVGIGTTSPFLGRSTCRLTYPQIRVG